MNTTELPDKAELPDKSELPDIKLQTKSPYRPVFVGGSDIARKSQFSQIAVANMITLSNGNPGCNENLADIVPADGDWGIWIDALPPPQLYSAWCRPASFLDTGAEIGLCRDQIARHGLHWIVSHAVPGPPGVPGVSMALCTDNVVRSFMSDFDAFSHVVEFASRLTPVPEVSF